MPVPLYVLQLSLFNTCSTQSLLSITNIPISQHEVRSRSHARRLRRCRFVSLVSLSTTCGKLTKPAPSFGDFVDALFGGGSSNSNEQRPQPSDYPGFPPPGSGSGVPFPFPTATGAPFPSGTSSVLPFPLPGSDSQEKRALHIDYELAAKAAPVVRRRGLKYRQAGGSALPSFSLLDPNDTPTATQSATELPGAPTDAPGFPTGAPELPTGGSELPTGAPTETPTFPTGFPTPPAGGPTAPFPFPTGDSPFPSGEPPFPTDAPFPPSGTGAPGLPGTGFPGTGFPGLPSTFGTVTRGPRPTVAPDAPGSEGGESETENGNAWLEWISDLLSGGKGGRE